MEGIMKGWLILAGGEPGTIAVWLTCLMVIFVFAITAKALGRKEVAFLILIAAVAATAPLLYGSFPRQMNSVFELATLLEFVLALAVLVIYVKYWR